MLSFKAQLLIYKYHIIVVKEENMKCYVNISWMLQPWHQSMVAPSKNSVHCSGFQTSLRNLGTTPSPSTGYFLPATSLAKFTNNFKCNGHSTLSPRGFEG